MIDPLELIDPKPYRDRPTACPKCRGEVCPHYIAARLLADLAEQVLVIDVDEDQAPADECGGGDLPKEARP